MSVDEISTDLEPEVAALVKSIDKKLKRIEGQLRPFENLIAKRDKLRAARRVLLSEKSQTGGAGSPRTRLSMEEVVGALRSIGPATAVDIASHLSMDPTTVRSHLNRHKGERYELNGDKQWRLAEEGEDDDE